MIKLLLLSAPAVAGSAWLAFLLLDGLRHYRRRSRLQTLAAPLRLEVIARHDFSENLFTVTLASRRRTRLPEFLPGQYVALVAGSNRQVRRYYSLAAWESRPHQYQLAIRRIASGLVSTQLHRSLQAGSSIELLPPQGKFFLDSVGREVVLIAGGIGISPLRAMLHACLHDPRYAESRVTLFYAAREEHELCFHGEFVEYAENHPRFNYYPLLSRCGASWQGPSGRLDAARVAAYLQRPQQADFYLCASAGMIKELRAGLLALQIDAERIRSEYFACPVDRADGERYRITVDRHPAVLFDTQPSLLHALQHAGIDFDTPCGSGQCGACRLKLKQGKCRWLAETCLELAEDEILACCTQPVSDLLLAYKAM